MPPFDKVSDRPVHTPIHKNTEQFNLKQFDFISIGQRLKNEPTESESQLKNTRDTKTSLIDNPPNAEEVGFIVESPDLLPGHVEKPGFAIESPDLPRGHIERPGFTVKSPDLPPGHIERPGFTIDLPPTIQSNPQSLVDKKSELEKSKNVIAKSLDEIIARLQEVVAEADDLGINSPTDGSDHSSALARLSKEHEDLTAKLTEYRNDAINLNKAIDELNEGLGFF